ncbi:hypothetical protein ACWGTO_28750 [Mesorhizobium sp. PL10]
MAKDDLKALLEQNGLADTIAILRDAAPDSLDCTDDQALAKMTLVLRVLSLPPSATSKLLEIVEELRG